MLMKLGMEDPFERIRVKCADGVDGPMFRPLQPPYPKTTPIANFGNFSPILMKIGGEV